jgi:hypothetical protein
MMEDDSFATPMEAVNQWAGVVGQDKPEVAWLLHDRDVWVKNPYYRGAPGRHPEDGPDECPRCSNLDCPGTCWKTAKDDAHDAEADALSAGRGGE